MFITLPVEEATVLLPTPAPTDLAVISNSAIKELMPTFLPHPDLIQDGEGTYLTVSLAVCLFVNLFTCLFFLFITEFLKI